MANNLTGFEIFFCSSWDGWEGDLEWVIFYDIEPNQLLINDIKIESSNYYNDEEDKKIIKTMKPAYMTFVRAKSRELHYAV